MKTRITLCQDTFLHNCLSQHWSIVCLLLVNKQISICLLIKQEIFCSDDTAEDSNCWPHDLICSGERTCRSTSNPGVLPFSSGADLGGQSSPSLITWAGHLPDPLGQPHCKKEAESHPAGCPKPLTGQQFVCYSMMKRFPFSIN